MTMGSKEGERPAEPAKLSDAQPAEDALRASRAYLSAVIASALDGIVTIDVEARIMDFNPAAEKMYGHAAADVMGKPVLDVVVSPESRDRQLANLSRWEATGQFGVLLPRQELMAVRADGTRFPVELTLVRLSEGPVRYVGFIRDLTDMKRVDNERRRLEEQLRHAQKMDAVGRLAGGIAHDFNNLLSVVLGFTELSLISVPSEDLADNLREIKKAADRAVGLVRQLLAFSRRQVLSPRILNPNDVLSNMEGLLRGLIGEPIELSLGLSPDVGQIKADPGQIEQMILNLVMNAREAMLDGGLLRIETTVADLDEGRIPPGSEARPGSFVRLVVQDSGTGMSDEVRAHVFEPFFTTKRTGKGTGLGLSTVYGIVTQSGGIVHFTTALGEGTRFEVFLPRVDRPPVVAGAPPPVVSARGDITTILLCEDEDAVRNLVRRILEAAGYHVLLARNGAEALELCQRADLGIDLLLTDAVMPVMSGPELLRRVMVLRPELRLMIMSGYSDRPAVSGIPFIAKPFTPVELEKQVRQALDAPSRPQS
ncbi:MAG: two-component system, cell cycle sensor histidine kinase and response regulator CckA [Myxococcales bacterium]|nr:two-component system, cell cycle sensor histidine kinase and response regulator CckA [Myxococcales bacterium]